MTTLRPYQATDKPFIFATMLKGLYYGCSFYNKIDQAAFFQGYSEVLKHLLYKPGISIVISCLEDDPDVIVGYAIYEHNKSVLHYCFVKAAFRSNGIARSMLKDININTCTHMTDMAQSIKVKRDWSFNPFMI